MAKKKPEKKEEKPNKLIIEQQLPPSIGNIKKLLIVQKDKKVKEVN